MTTPLDELAAYVDAYSEARAKAAHWNEVAEQARRVLENALGSTEIGTVNGQPRVRWTTIISTRLNTKKLAENEPDVYAAYTAETVSRRFTTVDPT